MEFCLGDHKRPDCPIWKANGKKPGTEREYRATTILEALVVHSQIALSSALAVYGARSS